MRRNSQSEQEEGLFSAILQQRGISEQQAKQVLRSPFIAPRLAGFLAEVLSSLTIVTLDVDYTVTRDLGELAEIFSDGIVGGTFDPKQLQDHPVRDRQRCLSGPVEFVALRQPAGLRTTDQVVEGLKVLGYCPANFTEACAYLKWRLERSRDLRWRSRLYAGQEPSHGNLVILGSQQRIHGVNCVLHCSEDALSDEKRFTYRLCPVPVHTVWGMDEWVLSVKTVH